MLDVHPPQEAVHGWRDFLVHLLTITIGLLIAVGIEGCVEWRQHRHLANEAEASLQNEIRSNAKGMQDIAADITKQQGILKGDVALLKEFIRTGKMPHGHMEINFHIAGFDDVSWKTAQATGAFAFMPYSHAQEYSDIYSTQDDIRKAEDQAARDAIVSLAPFMNESADDPGPSVEDGKVLKGHIEVLQGQLMLLDALVQSLDGQYKKFLAAHS